MGESRTLEALKYQGAKGPLLVLDQLKLPEVHEYIAVETTEQGWKTIRNMNVSEHNVDNTIEMADRDNTTCLSIIPPIYSI